MKNLNSLIIIFFVTVLLPGCGEELEVIEPSGNRITIGVIAPMSGTDRSIGILGVEGMRTAIHIQPYLKNGDTIRLLIEDDQNQPELTVAAFKKLATAGVRAVVVFSRSASALAINDIADEYAIPVVVALASHADIAQETRFVTQLSFDNELQGKVAALFVRDELLLERVAVFKNPDSSYSNSLSGEFIRKFRSLEGEIIDVVLVSSAPIDYQKTFTRLRDQGVQLLYLPMAGVDVLLVAKELEDMGWRPEVMCGDGLLTSLLSGGHSIDTLLDGFFTLDMYSSDIPKTRKGERANTAFRSLFDTRNSAYPASGYESLALIQDGLNRCKDAIAEECVNDMLHDMTNFEGLMGNITIQASGKSMRPLIVNRINGERMELVVKVY